MEKSNPFEASFTVLKMRYNDYDSSIINARFLEPGDSVNVFISLESVFMNLSMVQDLERKLVLNRNFDRMLASSIINLAAHYKRFFTGNQINTRVYLYHTDLDSNNYPQKKYDWNYRSYYTCKYRENPKFSMLTDTLVDTILPLVRKCCEFIPGVYYISARNIEGSVIPYTISELDKSVNAPRKNFIVGNELYDTQYGFLSGFLCHYFKRSFSNYFISCDMKDVIADIAKKPKQDCKDLYDTYSSYQMYVSLLACMGDKIRSVDGIDGVGIKTLDGMIREARALNRITDDTTSPNVIGEIFKKEELKDQFVNNYYCTAIPYIYSELTESDIIGIKTQIVDRFDNQGLMELNRTIFASYPLMLEALCV